MNRWKLAWGWISLALIFGGVGLSVFSAFLGAEKSRIVFGSGPMLVLWCILVTALVMGFLHFRSLLRCPGLLAMHLGPLLILVGGMINSERGHRLFFPEKTRWSYLPLRVGQQSREIRDHALRHVSGTLPFHVRLDAFEIERYPAEQAEPVFKFGTLAHDPATHRTEWQAQPLTGWAAGDVDLPGTNMRLTVLAVSGGDAERMQAEIAVTAGETRRAHRLTCEPGERFGRIALATLFPEAEMLPPGASIFLLLPEPPVRQYRSSLTFIDGNRQRSAQTRVNRPVGFGGYHFYQYAWGAEPELHTVLLVVSRAGTRVYFSGMVLLVFGVCWRFWIHPILFRRKGGVAACI